jgi:hypothetical protein
VALGIEFLGEQIASARGDVFELSGYAGLSGLHATPILFSDHGNGI